MKYVPAVLLVLVIVLIAAYTYIINREMDLSARISGIEPYETGSIQYGDEHIPVYSVRVSFSVDNHRGGKGPAWIVVSLSYRDLKNYPTSMNRLNAAADRRYEITFDTPTRRVVTEFDISHLAEMIHDGVTSLSTLEAQIFVEDRKGDLRMISQ